MRQAAERVLGNFLFDMWHIDMQSDTELRTEKLLGSKINMEARDLVVLLFAIEKKMNIRIERESIIDGRFDTFEHIVDLICNASS